MIAAQLFNYNLTYYFNVGAVYLNPIFNAKCKEYTQLLIKINKGNQAEKLNHQWLNIK